jgi:hypothetical protein
LIFSKLYRGEWPKKKVLVARFTKLLTTEGPYSQGGGRSVRQHQEPQQQPHLNQSQSSGTGNNSPACAHPKVGGSHSSNSSVVVKKDNSSDQKSYSPVSSVSNGTKPDDRNASGNKEPTATKEKSRPQSAVAKNLTDHINASQGNTSDSRDHEKVSRPSSPAVPPAAKKEHNIAAESGPFAVPATAPASSPAPSPAPTAPKSTPTPPPSNSNAESPKPLASKGTNSNPTSNGTSPVVPATHNAVPVAPVVISSDKIPNVVANDNKHDNASVSFNPTVDIISANAGHVIDIVSPNPDQFLQSLMPTLLDPSTDLNTSSLLEGTGGDFGDLILEGSLASVRSSESLHFVTSQYSQEESIENEDQYAKFLASAQQQEKERRDSTAPASKGRTPSPARENTYTDEVFEAILHDLGEQT